LPSSRRAAALRILVAAPVTALLLCLLGCGGSSAPEASRAARSRAPVDATLVLDFLPNGVHAGIYRALAAGYYRRQGIDLHVVQPTSTADTLRLIEAGKAQFGIADGIDVGAQIAAGRDAEGIMALLERPAGGLIALRSEGLRSPRQLDGGTVGITGVPSDRAVLETVVSGAGGDPGDVHVVTVGFNGAQALAAGRIDAFTGFVPADGVQLSRAGHPVTAFRLDEWGGPSYPGLVVFSTRSEIAADPALMRGFVAATLHGYRDTLRDPGRSVEDLAAANPGLDRGLAAATLAAYRPLFRGDARHYGEFVASHLRELGRYMAANGLADAPVPPRRYGTNRFVRAAQR
jgi:NitT/TauT family transport system substrate-binding protein/putative hydroxymethylpyrimidine transport system substrate-binding protein